MARALGGYQEGVCRPCSSLPLTSISLVSSALLGRSYESNTCPSKKGDGLAIGPAEEEEPEHGVPLESRGIFSQ